MINKWLINQKTIFIINSELPKQSAALCPFDVSILNANANRSDQKKKKIEKSAYHRKIYKRSHRPFFEHVKRVKKNENDLLKMKILFVPKIQFISHKNVSNLFLYVVRSWNESSIFFNHWFWKKPWITEQNDVRAVPILDIHVNFPFGFRIKSAELRSIGKRRDGKHCRFHSIWYTEHVVPNYCLLIHSLDFSSAFAQIEVYAIECEFHENERMNSEWRMSFIHIHSLENDKWKLISTWILNDRLKRSVSR